jgi:hypothetical protein
MWVTPLYDEINLSAMYFLLRESAGRHWSVLYRPATVTDLILCPVAR